MKPLINNLMHSKCDRSWQGARWCGSWCA